MHPTSFESKAEARAWGLRVRAAMTAAERVPIVAQITERLATSDLFGEARTLLTYVGSKDGELDTMPLIETALAGGKMVLVPITRPSGIMLWSRLEALTDLRLTPRGILEPRTEALDLVEPEGGLCVVPGVCFRRDGHRIGFGAGYYDRFLATFHGESIALSPEALFGVDFPVEAHDRPVTVVATESGMHVTGGGGNGRQDT